MRACLAVVCFVLGCGGSVDPAFTGQWKGTAAGTVSGKTFGGPFVISVTGSGSTVIASGLCDGSTGSVSALGAGRTAEFQTTLACPAASATCATTVATMKQGTIELRADSSLHVDTSGEVTGCDKVSPFTWGFVGTK